MAEMKILVEHLTKLNELNDKIIREQIKHFGLVLDAIVKSLNISVSQQLESLNKKSVEMVRSPMIRHDGFTFLPQLWSHEDDLRPLILHSGGRKTGKLFVQLHMVDDCGRSCSQKDDTNNPKRNYFIGLKCILIF